MKPTREELREQYLEAKKQGDKIRMSQIALKAYSLGYKKRKIDPFVQQVQDTLLK